MQRRERGGPGQPMRWRGHVPEAPEGAEGTGAGGAGGAVADGAAAKKDEPKAPEVKAEVKADAAAPKTETKAETKSAPAPTAKVEAKAEPAKTETAAPARDQVKAEESDVRSRLEALERRMSRERRDAAIGYLKTVPSVLSDEQLRALAPDVDASTPDGRAKLDQWRTANSNLFKASELRPDQRASELEKRLVTDKTDPAVADRTRRLMKSLWGAK